MQSFSVSGAGGLAQDGVGDSRRSRNAGPAMDQNGCSLRKRGAEGEDLPNLFEGGRLTIGQRRDDVIEVSKMDLGRLREFAAKAAFVGRLPGSQRVPDRNDVGKACQIEIILLFDAADGYFWKPGHQFSSEMGNISAGLPFVKVLVDEMIKRGRHIAKDPAGPGIFSRFVFVNISLK